MPAYDDLATFRKCAFRRLRDAKHLLSPAVDEAAEQGADTRHTRAAMYLCGYSVECMLKAYLISRHPPCWSLSDVLGKLRETNAEVRDICGAAGHDLRLLLALTQLETQMNVDAIKWMSACSKWKSTWRYNPTPASRSEAEWMVEAVGNLVNWINARM